MCADLNGSIVSIQIGIPFSYCLSAMLHLIVSLVWFCLLKFYWMINHVPDRIGSNLANLSQQIEFAIIPCYNTPGIILNLKWVLCFRLCFHSQVPIVMAFLVYSPNRWKVCFRTNHCWINMVNLFREGLYYSFLNRIYDIV